MSTLTALQTAMRLAYMAKKGRVAPIDDVEFDDIAIALAAAEARREPVRVEPIWDRIPGEKVILSGLSLEHIRLVLDALGEELDRYDSYRLQVAERRVIQMEVQLAAAPVATQDLADARCWRYLLDGYPRQIAAALDCEVRDIEDHMNETLPNLRG